MDTSVLACVDDFCGDGGNEDNLFLELEGESGKLLRFYWAADNELKMVVVGNSDHALHSSPSRNSNMEMQMQEDLSNGCMGSMEQLFCTRNTKTQTKVYNFEDLLSSSMPPKNLSSPSKDDQGGVRIDTDMSDISDHDPKSTEELGNRMNTDPKTVVTGDKGHITMFNSLARPSNSPPNKNRGLALVEIDREQRLQDRVETIRAEPGVRRKERKKREPWTNDEQKLFLMGMMIFEDKWRKIRKHFVRTKSSSQFGSHVQKFNKRKHQMNRKKHTINDIRDDDITHVVRLAPKEWWMAILSAMAARSNGGKTLVQQYPNAALQENASGCSTPTRRRPFNPAVQETVTNPLALIAQPASSIAFASSYVGPTPLQPASSYVAYADGRQTPLVQPSPCPHLGAAYLGYQSSTYCPANYQPLSLPQFDTTPSPCTCYSTPMRWNSYTGLAPTLVLHSSPGITQVWDCTNPWGNP